MALLPPNGQITLTQSASSISASLVVDDLSYSFEVFEYERKEYSNDFLMNLPNEDGTAPIFQKNIMNKTVQTQFVGCGTNSARSILPDDANVENILRKFTIKTFSIKGGPSSPSSVNAIDALAKDHVRRYSTFQAYFKKFGLKLSYQYFYSLRNETFTYLTQSGLTLTGFTGGSALNESNVLIRKFRNGYQYRDPRTGLIVVKDWDVQLDAYLTEDSQAVY